jgi:hypothetical protein
MWNKLVDNLGTAVFEQSANGVLCSGFLVVQISV